MVVLKVNFMQTKFKLRFVPRPQHTFHYTDALDEECSMKY